MLFERLLRVWLVRIVDIHSEFADEVWTSRPDDPKSTRSHSVANHVDTASLGRFGLSGCSASWNVDTGFDVMAERSELSDFLGSGRIGVPFDGSRHVAAGVAIREPLGVFRDRNPANMPLPREPHDVIVVRVSPKCDEWRGKAEVHPAFIRNSAP